MKGSPHLAGAGKDAVMLLVSPCTSLQFFSLLLFPRCDLCFTDEKTNHDRVADVLLQISSNLTCCLALATAFVCIYMHEGRFEFLL